jgi:hypothetical protein
VLLLGAGGGYDVLGGVPLFVELRERGIAVDFASVSFTALESLAGAERDPEAGGLYRIEGSAAVTTCYCPEAWLARWTAETQGQGRPVWGLSKAGVRPLREALKVLTRQLDNDLVVLVDGGIDLILRGDETSIGTPAEDLATLCAMAGLDCPSLAMCVGFGAELREGIRHAQALERIAELQRLGAFLGAATLNAATPAGQSYRQALQFVAAGQRDQRGSHVHDVVVAALEGQFGSPAPDVWISPLAALCWFFDVRGLAGSHLFLKHLEGTETIFDVTTVIRGCRKSLEVRPPSNVPI